MNVRRIRLLGLLALVISISGCASSYKFIHPPYATFINKTIQDSVKIAYRYNALWESNNIKYAKKEEKSDIRLVVIRIENDSRQVIHFKDDFKIYAGKSLITPIDNMQLYAELRQSPPSYMKYLLLTPIHLAAVNFGGSPNIFPFGYILGPGLCIKNMAKAIHANSNFKYELIEYDLQDQNIEPGAIVYGIIGLETGTSIPLTFSIIRKR
jgi:hypothetical protein